MIFPSQSSDVTNLYASRFQRTADTLAASLSSGRLGASTNAANAAIAASLDAEAQSAVQANANAVQDASVYAIADGALSTIQNLTGQMRALAVQAGNGTLSQSDRQAIDTVYQALGQEVDRVAASTSYNGTPLLSGAAVEPFQVGTTSGAPSQLAANLPTISGASLGLTGSAVSSRASAGQALDQLDGALSQLSVARAGIGAGQASLSAAEAQTQSQAFNATAAYERVGATDYAAATAAYQAALLGEQAAYSTGALARRQMLPPLSAVVA